MDHINMFFFLLICKYFYVYYIMLCYFILYYIILYYIILIITFANWNNIQKTLSVLLLCYIICDIMDHKTSLK